MSPPPVARVTEDMSSGLTIGQAGPFAGVTVRTVRHHHRLAWSTNPAGYPRYPSSELPRLAQVRTLAGPTYNRPRPASC